MSEPERGRGVSEQQHRGRWWRYAGLAFILMSALAALALVLSGQVGVDSLQGLLPRAGWRGYLSFIALVVVMQLLWLPRMWAHMIGGALFGVLGGAGLAMLGDTLSAVVCFGLARGSGSAWVLAALQKRRKAEAVRRLLAQRHPVVAMIVLRCLPMAHYTLVSYAAGLSGMTWRRFLLGNSLGLVPGSLVYGMVGAYAMAPSDPRFMVAVGAMVVALVVGTWLSRRVLRAT